MPGPLSRSACALVFVLATGIVAGPGIPTQARGEAGDAVVPWSGVVVEVLPAPRRGVFTARQRRGLERLAGELAIETRAADLRAMVTPADTSRYAYVLLEPTRAAPPRHPSEITLSDRVPGRWPPLLGGRLPGAPGEVLASPSVLGDGEGLGSRLVIDGKPHTVVGLTLPEGGGPRPAGDGLYLATKFAPQGPPKPPFYPRYTQVGAFRFADAATATNARDEILLLGCRLGRAYEVLGETRRDPPFPGQDLQVVDTRYADASLRVRVEPLQPLRLANLVVRIDGNAVQPEWQPYELLGGDGERAVIRNYRVLHPSWQNPWDRLVTQAEYRFELPGELAPGVHVLRLESGGWLQAAAEIGVD